MPPWRVQHHSGDVAAFHARDIPVDHRTATFFRADSPTLVIGSSQRRDSVDDEAAARHGVDVVRRRSGGGGVLLWPEEFVWLDLEIPATDALWSNDIGHSMWWVGELWRAALADSEPGAAVYRGRMRRTRWSADVCFAGTGPGEVLVETAKLVGISQRRTREAARFQSMIHLRWRPDVVASLVADKPPIEDLRPIVRTSPVSVDHIVAGLAAMLHRL
jgi:lipoate---protein ligase